MTFVDRSVALVRQAVEAVGKKPLARRAGVDHGVLRQIGCDARFSPHARKLRALETAARAVLRERGEAVRETTSPDSPEQRECA